MMNALWFILTFVAIIGGLAFVGWVAIKFLEAVEVSAPQEPRGGITADQLQDIMESFVGRADVSEIAAKINAVLFPSPPSGGGGWPSREQLIETVLISAREHGNDSPVDYGDAEGIVDHLLALFPPVVGWQPSDREDDLVAALRSIAEGNLGDQPWQAGYETIKQVARNAIAYRETLPAAPLTTDGVG